MSAGSRGGPSGPQQPRWAWWVVGIAVPLVGILVTVLVNGSTSAPPPPPSTGQTGPAASTSGKPGTGSTPSPKVRFGPRDVRVESSYEDPGHVDLDSDPPLRIDTSTNGTDVFFDPTASEPVDVRGDELAPLPSTGPDPSEAACAAQLQNNGTRVVKLARGTRFCVRTGEGRTAYARVLTAPLEGEGTVRLKVTVWELPN